MTTSNSEDPAISTKAGPYPSSTFERSSSHSSSQPHQLSSASSYADLNYLFGSQDPAMLVPKPSRNRRKSSQGSEHTKHRRTRSGCYTCRSRRVKVCNLLGLTRSELISYSAMKHIQYASVRRHQQELRFLSSN